MSKKLNLEGNLFSMGGGNQFEKKNESESPTIKDDITIPEIKTKSKVKSNVSNEINSESESVSKNVSHNDLTISRKKVTDYTIPMTYRLRAETIEKIRRQARTAEMGVAEYLQAVLDLVLDKVVIK